MFPMSYTEENMVRVPGACMHDGTPQLLAQWLAAPNARDLWQCVELALQASGFDWLSHLQLAWHAGLPVVTQMLSSHAHPRWAEQVASGEDGAHDSTLGLAAGSTLPIAWSVEDLHDRLPREVRAHAAADGEGFVHLLRHCGIHSGVLLPLPARPAGAGQALVVLHSHRRGVAWIDDGVLTAALMLSLCLNELLSVHMCLADQAHRPTAVSPTRQEILWHLAQGQSNKQIAHRLQLSADTVKYHMRELRRHFNVRNRMQLVSTAMSHAWATQAGLKRATYKVQGAAVLLDRP